MTVSEASECKCKRDRGCERRLSSGGVVGPAVRAVHGPEDMRPSRIPPADAGAPRTELGRCFPMRSTPRTVRPTEMSGCAPRHPHIVPRTAEVHTSELPSCKPDARFWFNPSISCCLPLFPHGNPSTASLSPAGLHYAGPRGPSQRRGGGAPCNALRQPSLHVSKGCFKGPRACQEQNKMQKEDLHAVTGHMCAMLHGCPPPLPMEPPMQPNPTVVHAPRPEPVLLLTDQSI